MVMALGGSQFDDNSPVSCCDNSPVLGVSCFDNTPVLGVSCFDDTSPMLGVSSFDVRPVLGVFFATLVQCQSPHTHLHVFE